MGPMTGSPDISDNPPAQALFTLACAQAFSHNYSGARRKQADWPKCHPVSPVDSGALTGRCGWVIWLTVAISCGTTKQLLGSSISRNTIVVIYHWRNLHLSCFCNLHSKLTKIINLVFVFLYKGYYQYFVISGNFYLRISFQRSNGNFILWILRII